MGIKNNRECIICGRSYHYCPTCGADVGKPTWYAIFDGQNCQRHAHENRSNIQRSNDQRSGIGVGIQPKVLLDSIITCFLLAILSILIINQICRL